MHILIVLSQAAGEKGDGALTQELNELKSKKLSNKSIRESKQEAIAASSNQIRQLSDQLNSVSTIDVEARNLEREIATLTQSHSTLEREIRELNYDQSFRDLQSKTRDLEGQRGDLEQVLTRLQSQAEDRAKLAVKRGDQETKQRGLDDM